MTDPHRMRTALPFRPVQRPAVRRRVATSGSSRAPWAWAVGGLLLGTVVSAIAFLPAQTLAWGLAQASGGRVQLAQARGTVWTGSAQLVLTGGHASRDRAALPGRLHWQLRPQWTGLRLQLNADCCTASPLQLRLTAGLSGVAATVNDGTSQWPAALLAGLGTPWNTVQLQGQLALQSRDLAVHWAAGRLRMQGEAVLEARAVSSRLSTLKPLGSYRLVVQGGDSPTLRLSTLEGALQLQGQGQWVGQRLRFSGEAEALPERADALSNLLNLLGRRQGTRALISLG